MDAPIVRRTLLGAAIGGALFAAVSLYRSWISPGSLVDYAGPVGLMVVIGATVGGLVGPMAGSILARILGRDDGAEANDDGGARVEVEEDGEGVEAPAPRQPAWLTLLVGLAVGYGVGSAWGRVWAGLAVGLILALLARRIFR